MDQTLVDNAIAQGWDHVAVFITTLPWGPERAELRLWLLKNINLGWEVPRALQTAINNLRNQ